MKNGIVDISTMEKRDHTPDVFFSSYRPIEFDKKAECPLFKKFLTDISCDDIGIQISLLQFGGLCQTRDTSYQLAFILKGDGSNGKSLFARILVKTLGGDANTACMSMGLLTEKYGAAEIKNKNLVVIDETKSVDRIMETDVLKKIITGETLMAQKKFGHPFSFIPYAKIMILTNPMPRSCDQTDGFFRRFRMFPFNASFKGSSADKHLEEKLTAELPGIFNLFIDGLKMLREQDWIPCEASDHLNEMFRITNSTVYAFVLDETEEYGDDKTYMMDEFYRRYKEFCDREGHKPKNKENVRAELDGMWITPVSRALRFSDDRKQIVGLRLKASMPFSMPINS
jgi:putative DNA primase/helicase